MRRDSNRAIATDAEGHELRVNDNVKEIDGEVSVSVIDIHGLPFTLPRLRGAKGGCSTRTSHSSPSSTIGTITRTAVSLSPALVLWYP